MMGSMKTSLYDQLKDYLLSAKSEWATVAKDCEVDLSWIYKFMRGEIKDPGVLRTERILKYGRSKGWRPTKAASQPQEQKAA